MTSESVPIPSSLRDAHIGVSYSVRSSSPSPTTAAMAASIASSSGFAGVRIVNPAADHIREFSGSPLPVFLSIPNEAVAGFGNNSVLARDWIDQNLVPFLDTVKFIVISLGVDFLVSFSDPKLLMAALNNFHDSLKEFDLETMIKVSTTFSFEHIIESPFPPSAAKFADEHVMSEILEFIARIKSFFVVNLYPQILYVDGAHGVADRINGLTLGFTLSDKNQGPLSYVHDNVTCVRYYGLFDCMLSSVFYAISSAAEVGGCFVSDDIRVIIAETGWPVIYEEDEDPSETEAMAGIYFDNLVTYLCSSTYKSRVAYTFIYELFDDPHSNIDVCVDRRWGIYSDNGRSKYPGVFPSPSQLMD